jgi:hypothetical protein
MDFPIPSPVILERIGLRFRKAVAEFAAEGDVPVIRFAKSSSGCSPGPRITAMRVVVGSAVWLRQGRPSGERPVLLSGG